MNEANPQNAIIRIFHVHKNYGGKKALIDTTLDVSQNEFLFITGPSGAGKTTLLKLLYLGEPVSEGQILVSGINLSRIPHTRIPFLRRKIGIIFQDLPPFQKSVNKVHTAFRLPKRRCVPAIDTAGRNGIVL